MCMDIHCTGHDRLALCINYLCLTGDLVCNLSILDTDIGYISLISGLRVVDFSVFDDIFAHDIQLLNLPSAL